MTSMLKSLSILAAYLVLQVAASPIPISTTSDGSSYVQLDFDVQRSSSSNITKSYPSHRSLNKRDTAGSASLTLVNEQSFYLSEVNLGTPAQKIGVLIDTGSSDLWVQSSSNPHCSEYDCSQYGTFDSSSSSSYKDLGTAFSIQYLDNTYAKGDWATDDVSFGSYKLNDLQFGYASDSTSAVGVLGIGFTSLESASTTYDNLPVKLADQGIISKAAYSLYLNSASATSGTVLFGAIDNAKYTGSLVTLPIPASSSGGYYDLQVEFDSITLPSGKVVTNTAGPAVLDSGTTLTGLPSSAVTTIGTALGFTYNSNAQAYVKKCSAISTTNQNFTYKLGGATITVPLSQLIESLQNSDGSTSDYCALGFFTNDQVILGDNFLRSAYVVYDLADKEISLAQVKYTSSQSISVIS